MKRILLISFMLLSALITDAWAQDRTVSGKVTDEVGEAVPGVNIVLSGTTTGTTTDIDGNWKLSVPAEGGKLIFSFVGMTTQEVEIGARSVIDIVMESGTELQEVVVLGYSTQDKKTVVGSPISVGEEKLSQMPLASVDQSLQGNIPGLHLAGTSGTPGSSINILIRGRSSLTASTAPLFVIDGVPVVNSDINQSTASSSMSPLAALNPENVESITVLKDPASTAPYGARGTNGVIVITTKKGKSGKAEFNFTASYGVQNDAINGPEVLTGAQREELYFDGIYNTYGEGFGFDRAGAQGFYEANAGFFGTAYTDWRADGAVETRWQDVLTNKDAVVQNYNVSARAGDEKTNYFVSIGYTSQEATVIGSEFERISGALTLGTQLADNLYFSTSNNMSYAYQDGLLEQSAYFSGPRTAKYFMTPLSQPYNEDGTANITNLASNVRNPLWIADNDVNDSKVTRIINNNSLKWDTPLEGLTAETRFSIDYQHIRYQRYQNRTHGDADDIGGYASLSTESRVNTVWQNSLTYAFDVNSDHNIRVKLLQEFQKSKIFDSFADGESFAADGLVNLSSAGLPTGASSNFTDWAIGSYLALVDYTFQSKYIFYASYRREGNSRFPADFRWGNFYSMGVAWNMHDESFLSGVGFINQLKLRASVGRTGNAGIGLNRYQSSLGFSADYDGSAAIFPSSFGNSQLSWEKADSYEVGMDFAFMDNRISGAFQYYSRTTFDMLQTVPLSYTSGFDGQDANIGDLENTGIELNLDVAIVQTSDLQINLGGNLGTNKNRVTKMARDGNGEEIFITTGTRRSAEGHTAYEWYMPTYAGVNPDNGNAMWYTDETNSETTEVFGEAQRAFQGAGAVPTILAGVNLNVNYKGFYVTAQMNYAGGHKVWEPWTRYTMGGDRFATDLFNGINTLMDRWQQPGDITNVPKITHTIEPWRTHSRFLHDGDYMRLRNVTVGYNVNANMLSKTPFTGANIFVRGINLWTWVKDPDLKWDPEIEGEGFASLTTPPVKSVIVGVNLKF